MSEQIKERLLQVVKLSFIAAASFVSVVQAQTLPPSVPWSAAPGAAGFEPGTAGVGPFVDAVADLSVSPSHALNSWWAGGYFNVDGQKLGYIYHLMLLNSPQGKIIVESLSLTHVGNNSYYLSSKSYPVQPDMVSTKGFKIVTATSSIEGTYDDLHVVGTLKDAQFDLHLRAASRVLFNGGTGIFPLLGAEMREYSVPVLATTGSITIGKNTYAVIGNSWFDRQWGAQTLEPAKWLWLGINLTNGDALSVWQFKDLELNQPRTFVTILHKDGSQTVTAAEATPDPSSTWKSDRTDNTYPLRWTVKVPQLHTSLTVTSLVKSQELIGEATGNAAYEGLSEVTGTYKGLSTSGVARLELVGAWK